MIERWRRPVIPIAVEEAVGTISFINGRPRQDLEFVLKPEDVARIKLGYVCVFNGCFEPQERPFPEHCSLCGFPMRELQTVAFELLYQGEERLRGGGVADELAEMLERKQREKREAATGPSQILVPRGVEL